MQDIICGVPLAPRALRVEILSDYKLLITFTDGKPRVFDAKPLLNIPAFSKLRDTHFFNLVKIEHGTLSWPCDIDYCPDTLYLQSY